MLTSGFCCVWQTYENTMVAGKLGHVLMYSALTTSPNWFESVADLWPWANST